MHCLKLSVIVIAMVAFHAFAESKGEGGGEAEGGEKGAESTAVVVSKDKREFTDKSAKMVTLTNRIADQRKQFEGLVHKKAETKKAAEKQAIIQQMVELNAALNKDIDTFNKLKSDLALRFPNQGIQLNRRYETQSKRTVEEAQGVAGLDEMLTRTKKVIEKKFAPFMEDEKEREQNAKLVAPEEEAPKRLRLEK